MKRSRFTESQIVAVLKEGEAGMSVAELCRKHGVSNAAYSQSHTEYLPSARLNQFCMQVNAKHFSQHHWLAVPAIPAWDNAVQCAAAILTTVLSPFHLA